MQFLQEQVAVVVATAAVEVTLPEAEQMVVGSL
jgi:hypothetical protein